KQSLIAMHRSALTRPSAVAAGLAFHQAHGLDPRRYFDYDQAIARVRARDVVRVAAIYLDWARATITTVGALVATPEAARRIRGVRKRLPKSRPEKRPRPKPRPSRAGEPRSCLPTPHGGALT
ncbi:MAG: hypothetical protein AAGC55_02605, partial [Myxococcota bacterium]